VSASADDSVVQQVRDRVQRCQRARIFIFIAVSCQCSVCNSGVNRNCGAPSKHKQWWLSINVAECLFDGWRVKASVCVVTLAQKILDLITWYSVDGIFMVDVVASSDNVSLSHWLILVLCVHVEPFFDSPLPSTLR